MICIVNIEPEPKAFGIHKYSLRINNTEVCQFEHKREEGLGVCLRKAANAYTKHKWNQEYEIFKNIDAISVKRKGVGNERNKS